MEEQDRRSGRVDDGLAKAQDLRLGSSLLPPPRGGTSAATATTGSDSGVGKPAVSVVLPVYNSSDEVMTTLAELERQTYPSKEIIVVDDGST
ncbi:MAG: glycosyltransferase, partial [Thaumarchaeota archaeon]|nr:glycosyltransferase [Nitrososphaerota archaeon]